MVNGGASPGSQATLCGVFSGPAVSPVGVADPIFRFCLLAARLVTGKGAAAADSLLEGHTGGGSFPAGPAHRQTTSCRAKLAWRDGDLCPAQRPSGAAESAGTPRPSHALHDTRGRFCSECHEERGL